MLESCLRNVICHIPKRFSSSSSAGAVAQYGPNNTINPYVYNRNPRNLERLRIAPKPGGFGMDAKPMNYWNKLVIQKTNKHVTAFVEHHSGTTVVSASTKEWAVKKHLRSTTDMAAMDAIGQILAQRCLECGLLEVQSFYEADEVSSKVATLLKSMEKGGVVLSEPERFLPHRHWSREVKEDPTQIYEDPQ